MPRNLDIAAFDPGPWQRQLAQIAHRYEVPGMAAGVVAIDQVAGREQRFVATTGLTSLETRVPVDRDTVFQIGSVTKLFTAVMIMQLRDEGKLTLDTPVAELIEGFTLASDHAGHVTVRHLLTHTSGIDGDLFTDTGRGDDCVAQYVATLSEAQSLFAPGTGWSYCNSGFVLLGRIIELADNQTWDASVQERVAEPLGLARTVTLPEDVLRFRAAYGHLRPADAPAWTAAPAAMLPRSVGPAGLITSSVDDLLSFAGAVLRGGTAPNGSALLRPDTLAEMTDKHWELDPAARRMAPEWGLGWSRDHWQGQQVWWHGGRTSGHNTWFQVLPDAGVAFVVFTNGGTAGSAAYEVYSAFAAQFADVDAPRPLAPAGPPAQAHVADHWLGTYADAATTITVRHADSGGFEAHVASDMDTLRPVGDIYVLHPTDSPSTFVYPGGYQSAWEKISFSEIDGTPVLYTGRALPRQEPETD